MTEKMEMAKKFFREAHDSINQKRKYSGESYWTHTEAVADMLWEATHNETLYIAGLGHDCEEDVAELNPEYSLIKIRALFGVKVANLVFEVTNQYTKENYPKLNRVKRKELELQRLAQISKEAKSIKLADIAHNIKGIIDQNFDFGKVYLVEKMMVMNVLKDGNPILFKTASDVISEEIKRLAIVRKLKDEQSILSSRNQHSK